jgi:conjugative relaxase-like TrwC/TraI family protein
MSIHKLTAGSGYDYLTRQVAAFDATEKGHVGLASYYTERGESPGAWIGSGIAGIDRLNVRDAVTAEQMRALFGAGMHPLANQRLEQLGTADLTAANVQAATRLGAPFKVYAGDVSPFRVEVAKRIATRNRAVGRLGGDPISAALRARVRTEVAREFFRNDYGRDPIDAREIAATIAKQSRPRTQTVAGYDLTFSPVKSVSTLWATADRHLAAQIERAHQAAVRDALSFIEGHALFTRQGRNGVRQVNVRGLVAAAFTHRDSRAGDPDLHTHVAVANKVQTLDGRWLSIDGRVLFKATVAASETYNTALEHHLRDRLGVLFAERGDTDPRLRPIREIVGVDPALNRRWSARRASIESRRGELATQFQRDHGRPPTPVEMLHLAQQATLETRDAKHEPRTLTEQRTTWHNEAAQVLGGPQAVHAMVQAALHPSNTTSPTIDAAWVAAVADRMLAAMEEHRSTWQIWHVRAEAQRQIRAANITTDKVEQLVDLVAEVLNTKSIPLTPPDDGIVEPVALRRADGSSVYTVAGSELFTSARILQAERRLAAAAGGTDGRTIGAVTVDLALLESAANGMALDTGQEGLVRSMASSGARLQLAIAPAGAGKTTALQTLTHAWLEGGGQVLGLAPSAAAAAQLRDHTGVTTDTLAKLTWSLQHLNEPAGELPDWAHSIGPLTLVLIDEAGMADTLSLDTAVQFIISRGGSVRLIGDDQQLAAIGAGGVLRDIQASHGAVRLTELHRFHDPAEAAASLALRHGRPESLGFYFDRQRIHVGDLALLTETLFDAWRADRSHGLDSVMLAPTRDLVAELNQRARAHRLASAPTPGPEVALADGNRASAGELIITRHNDRRLRTSATDWVKNGDRWIVLTAHQDGGLRVQHSGSGRTIDLPASYVRDSVELGYATTVHTAQGITADTMHGLITGQESRQQLYAMCTRGCLSNHVYLQLVGDGDPHTLIRPDTMRPSTATELLEHILARDDTPKSASTLMREQQTPAVRLGESVERYIDALDLAAEMVVGSSAAQALQASANQLVPGLVDEPAWPTLRAHLLLLAMDGADPLECLRAAYDARELTSADDRAAVLDWRLDDTSQFSSRDSPLPWLPPIPTRLLDHEQWGPYLTARAQLVIDLVGQVRAQASNDQHPSWAEPHRPVPLHLAAEIRVWRAAMRIDTTDRRPTGPAQMGKSERVWQNRLDQALATSHAAMQEWAPVITQLAPAAARDGYIPVLAQRLATLSKAGVDADRQLRLAIAEGVLPDDHAAAALWWRINRFLPPGLGTEVDQTRPGTTPPGVEHDSRHERWVALSTELDPRLLTQRDWPVLANIMQIAHDQGHDVPAVARQLVAESPLNELPAQDLRYRLYAAIDLPLRDSPAPTAGVRRGATEGERRLSRPFAPTPPPSAPTY